MAAFGLGADERMIGFADAQGIAFSPIQGLHVLSRTRSADIELLKQEALARTSKLLALQEMVRKLSARLDEITAELSDAR